jgi:hypothetical protein
LSRAAQVCLCRRLRGLAVPARSSMWSASVGTPAACGIVGELARRERLPHVEQRRHHPPTRFDHIRALEQSRVADHAVEEQGLIANPGRGAEVLLVFHIHVHRAEIHHRARNLCAEPERDALVRLDMHHELIGAETLDRGVAEEKVRRAFELNRDFGDALRESLAGTEIEGNSGPYHSFAHAVTQILEGRIASLATIRKRLAMGCVMEMPAHDKAGRALCDADGNQIFKDKVFRPNRRAIEWKLMLLERRTYLERKDPWSETVSTETPETDSPEKEAPHKGLIDLFRAVQKKDPTLFEPMAPKPRVPRRSRRSHGSRGRPLGRRTKLTPEIQARIIRYFGECSNITHAGLRAGISKATLFEWLQRGKREGKREEEGRYRDFFEAFDLARAEQVAALAVRHHQVALGGIVPLPVLDRFGRQCYDATAKPRYRPVRLLPNAAALAWELCVLDPKTYNLPTRPVKSTRRVAFGAREARRRLFATLL